MSYVLCPVTITSPAPDYGLPANLECGQRCEVKRVAQVMHFRCPLGHDFYARPSDMNPPPQNKHYTASDTL
jgi:hypothetical protein